LQPTHLSFIIAAANLRAFVYGLKGTSDENYYKKTADAVVVPQFTPKSGVRIQVNENEEDPEAAAGDGDASSIVKKLPTPSSLAGYRLNPVEFEKDDDTNFHIDFITAASNYEPPTTVSPLPIVTPPSRSLERSFPPSPPQLHSSPAWSAWSCTRSSTARRTSSRTRTDSSTWLFPSSVSPSPSPRPRRNTRIRNGRLWDRIEFKGDPTLKEFVGWFKKELNLDILMVSEGVSMLWSSFVGKKKVRQIEMGLS
jgi:ubiquitin-activating enzyme E1